MPIEIIKKAEQVTGSFDNGSIFENKPLGFPHEFKMKPYSNLFYWANAHSEKGGLIDVHPHKGFEIMSFVLEGEIEHFDTKMNDWLKLNAGDVQIIRAGSGISHAEKVKPGGRIFQIWFDPNLQVTLHKPASYDDYKPDVFPLTQRDGYFVRIFKGNGSPIQMDSEGIEIMDYSFSPGSYTLDLSTESYYSTYLIYGDIKINEEHSMSPDDFAKISFESSLNVSSEADSRLFVIKTPQKLSYKTYFEMNG